MTMHANALLIVSNFNLAFLTENGHRQVLFDVSFAIAPNQIVGLVGESGSGKSVTSLAIMGLLPQKRIKILRGEILYSNTSLLDISRRDFRKLRAKEIAMIFQEPMSCLNPTMRCGKQVVEVLRQHTKLNQKAAKKEVLSLFEKVKLPDPKRAYSAYPHQLSGGQKQRIVIAMAIACKPKLLIADEPTTALDVTVQKEIITLLRSLQQETGMSILFISHDLSLVSEIADRLLVMYKGKIIEKGATQAIFSKPTATYTKALLHTRPAIDKRLKKLPTVASFTEEQSESPRLVSDSERKAMHQSLYSQPAILEVDSIRKQYFSRLGWFRKKTISAVDGVSFKLYEGETLGVVGESGSGKSTLGAAILGLLSVDSGKIWYKGTDITKLKGRKLRAIRREMQLIFQDPFASLHPRLSIGKAIMEPLQAHKIHKNRKERKAKVIELLQNVGLAAEYYHRFPHQLSGGQRQRVGIARTIAMQPKIIVCDESVSALDISVQAQVLNLLNELKEKYKFTYVFISHDLAVVKYMSDQLLVMHQGKIEEKGEADQVYAAPKEAYTKKLIASIPKGL